MDAKEAARFEKVFIKVVRIFFGLQNLYVHDEPRVVEKSKLFKKYLEEFNKKYPNLKVVLEEHDFTSDDLKILLTTYKSAKDISEKYKLDEFPLTLKANKKHNLLQVLVNYKRIEHSINPAFQLLCVIGTEKVDNSVELKLPSELQYLSLEISEGFSSSDSSKAHWK